MGKYPGIEQHLKALNLGMSDIYNRYVILIQNVVKSVEKGWHGGVFNDVLKHLCNEYQGTYSIDSRVGRMFHEKFIKNFVGSGVTGFSIALTHSRDYVTARDAGLSDTDAEIDHATLRILFHDIAETTFSFPVFCIESRGKLIRADLDVPSFVPVTCENGKICTEDCENNLEQIKKLTQDISVARELVDIVMGENKRKRNMLRDEINEFAKKYEIKEAIFEGD